MIPPQSGIGIMVEGCESMDDYSEGTEDFIELPAITKPSVSDITDIPDIPPSSPTKGSRSSSPLHSKHNPLRSSSKVRSQSGPTSTAVATTARRGFSDTPLNTSPYVIFINLCVTQSEP